MYTAINNRVIVKVKNDTNLNNQTLLGEVIATTDVTKELQGKTVIAERRHFTELADTGEEATTNYGIILGDKISYASLDINNIVAIKDSE